MKAIDKIDRLQALRAEIRTLTVEPPQAPDLARRRAKDARAKKWVPGWARGRV